MMNDDNMIFSMKGKILNISNETSMKNIDIELFKSIVSNERRQFRRIYQAPETIDHYPRQMIVSNNYPYIDAENAISRRLAIVEFKKSPESPDIGLLDKIIRDDLPMLFKFMIQGAKKLLQHGQVIIPEITNQIIKEVKQFTSAHLFMNEKGLELSLIHI